MLKFDIYCIYWIISKNAFRIKTKSKTRNFIYCFFGVSDHIFYAAF